MRIKFKNSNYYQRLPMNTFLQTSTEGVEWVEPDTLTEAFELMKRGFEVKVTKDVPLNAPHFSVGAVLDVEGGRFVVEKILTRYNEIVYYGPLTKLTDGKKVTVNDYRVMEYAIAKSPEGVYINGV